MLAIIAICASSVSCSNDYYINKTEEELENRPVQEDTMKEQIVVVLPKEEFPLPDLNIEDAYIPMEDEEESFEEDLDETDDVIQDLKPTEEKEVIPPKETEEVSSEDLTLEDEEALEEVMYKLVGLTFDDGPGKYTDELLEVLEKHGHTATFFLVGNRINTYDEVPSLIVNQGSEIGIHTYSHESFTSLGVDGTLEEVNKTKGILDELGVPYSDIVRPPYGSVNSTIKEGVDFPMILWNIDTRDWESRDPEKVCEEILKGLEEGNIILLHDIHSTTIDGVIMALEQMPSEYKFVSISRLCEEYDYQLEDGKCYYSLKMKH